MYDTTLNMKNKVEADALFKKAKKQKLTAIIDIIGGAAITVVGLSILSGDDYKELGIIMTIVGSGCMAISIPYFISSENKRKANLLLMHEKIFFDPQSSIKVHLVSLGVKLNL